MTLERTGSVFDAVGGVGDAFDDGLRETRERVALGEAGPGHQPGQLLADDLLGRGVINRLEGYDAIDPIEELRRKKLAHGPRGVSCPDAPLVQETTDAARGRPE